MCPLSKGALMNIRNVYIILGLSAILLWAAPAWAENFNIDPQNSVVTFKMDNLEGYTTGAFGLSNGTVELSEDRSKLTALSFDVDVASVNTESALRDGNLRGPIFFDVAKFPTAKFVATTIDNGKISGDLTLKSVTKPVSLNYTIKDAAAAFGKTMVTLKIQGTIKRSDFGITFNRTLEKGTLLLGDAVEVAGQLMGTLK